MTWAGRTLAFAAALGMTAAFAAPADIAGPVPPCGADPVPAYADLGQMPDPQSWRGIDWLPPRCLGAWPRQFRFMIALAGRIGKADHRELLARLGAVSTNRGVRYFSVTENAWRELIRDASALSGPDPALRRGDFTAAEIASGASLYFVEEDNRSSKPVVYVMHATEATPSRIIVQTANVTPIESFMLTLFPPDTLLATYIFVRLEGGEWGLYVMSASTRGASGMVSLATASYVNRAQALFGHLARIAPAVNAPAN